MMEQTLNKKCPMTALMDKCIGDKCQLWVTATIAPKGKFGKEPQMTCTGCVFVVQLAVTAPPTEKTSTVYANKS